MRGQRSLRSSSMYTTQSIDMNSSKALLNNPNKSILRKSSVKKSKQQFPVINDSKQMDDQYIDKLHNHISFLNSNISKMKTEQTDYKTQMMNMMHPKNDKKVVDHAITTQNKYKDMKSKLIAQIHELQNKNVYIITECIALEKKKQYLEDALETSGLDHEVMANAQKITLDKARDRYQTQRERREERKIAIERLYEQHAKTFKEHFQIENNREKKAILDNYDQQMYDATFELWVNDLEEKKLEDEKLTREIQKIKVQQSQDKHYLDALDKKEELEKELEEYRAEYDRVLYSIDERQQLIKYAEKRKDDGVLDYQNLKTELQKYQDIMEQINERNEKKVEDFLKKHVGPELQLHQAELIKVRKLTREAKAKMEKLEGDLREQTIFIKSKEKKLKDLDEENKKTQAKYDIITANLNSLQFKYDSRMPNLQDEIETLVRNKRQQEKMVMDKTDTESEHIYLKSKAMTLQDRVHLEEEMRKVQVEQLKNVTFDNQQFNHNVNNLYQNWGTMSQCGKSQLIYN